MTDQVQGYTFQYAYSNEIIQAFATQVQPPYPIEYNLADGILYVENTGSLLYNTGNGNVAIGSYALTYNTSGTENFAFGIQPLYQNTTGSNNIAIGDQPLFSNTIGSYNIAIGNYALDHIISGNKNIAIGNYALASSSVSSTLSNNIWIGNAYSAYIVPLNNGSFGNNELFIAPNVGLIGGVDNNTYNATSSTIVPATSSYIIIYGELATSFGGTAPTSITAGASPYTFKPSSTTNQIVIISGGAVSSITLNGTTTGLTSGTFYCRAGDSLTITYTTAPTILQYNV